MIYEYDYGNPGMPMCRKDDYLCNNRLILLKADEPIIYTHLFLGTDLKNMSEIPLTYILVKVVRLIK